jgi:hypothetical protein
VIRLLLLSAVVAITACTSPESSEFHKGTLTRPPPAPAARPGVGAPMYGQPGPQMHPRSPHGRVLPETPETRKGPGIWAAHPPDDAPTITFNWDVPVPEDDDEAAEQLRKCAKTMEGASARTLQKHDVERLDRININWRLCWPHMAVLHCIDRERGKYGSLHPRLVEANRQVNAALGRARIGAEEAYAERCNGVPLRPGLEDMLGRALSAAGYRP